MAKSALPPIQCSDYIPQYVDIENNYEEKINQLKTEINGNMKLIDFIICIIFLLVIYELFICKL
jgi:hypothetical protein